ncbi:MAG: type IV secretory system conjugative DNA transfer family protein [Solirubrobacterales bacterium]|nr:type IV secretory system conjugative DNA transfer family protein [Solirubrobacterales bacterium]
MTPPAAERTRIGPFEVLLLAGVAILAVLEGGLWMWTGTAGALFGSGWPHLTLAALWHATAGVARHLSDPRRGFSQPVRAGLPGPAAFYATLLLLATLAGLITAGAISVWERHRSVSGGRSKDGGARWAGAGDLVRLRHTRRRRRGASRDAAKTGPGPAVLGLSLGHQGLRLLRAEERHALIVFGPAQSGKSAGIAIPNILEWPGPAIVVSIKPDLLDATIAARRQRGEVHVFDPFALWDQPSHTWSPLASARTWNGALETAQRIASAGEIDTGSVKGGSFWSQAAEQRLAPLLYAAARTGRGIGEVVQWIYGQGGGELDRLIHRLIDTSRGEHERADAQHAYDAHLAFTQLAGETRGSIEGTAQILLSAYRSPTVVRSAAGNQITAPRLLDGANTVYLISDSRRSKLLRPILIGLLTELLDRAYETANGSPNRRLPSPLLVCLDELGNAVPIPNLAEIASTAASHNIQLVSIFHDIAQARTRYHDQALTVINNHRARMLLSGVADIETLKYFSELVGEEEVKDRSDPDAPVRRRPLAPPDQLRQIKPQHGLLVYGSLRPAQVRLRLYFNDRKLKNAA